MAFCGECGCRIPDNSYVCPTCGAPALGGAEQQGSNRTQETTWQQDNASGQMGGNGGKPSSGGSSGASAKKKIVLAENEIVVRTYRCSEIRRPSCTGSLTVTNMRVFFEGDASNSRISKEMGIDSVSGLDCYYGLNVNILWILIGIALFILCIALLALSSWLAIIPGVFAVVIIAQLGAREAFYLSIYSCKATGAPIQLGEGIRSLIGNGVVYTLRSAPTTDTDRMLNELGALVLDLQTMGDRAIEKWQEV